MEWVDQSLVMTVKVPIQDAHMYGECRKVNEFEKLNRVGAGTYGVVYRARDTRTKEIVSDDDY